MTKSRNKKQRKIIGNLKKTIITISKKINFQPITVYTFVIGISISLFLILEATLDVSYDQINDWFITIDFPWGQTNFPRFVTLDDRIFANNFVEWFGVFYGFFLPLILVRSWEQFDSLDREFDREADAIKILFEDIRLLNDNELLKFKIETTKKLNLYADHICSEYQKEHLTKYEKLRVQGDSYLQDIRKSYRQLIGQDNVAEHRNRLEPLTMELLERLNDAIDTRGDRIAIFKQRLYESLRFIAVLTSLLWLIPFYFLDFDFGILGWGLRLGVTFLIIIVLSIIDDLDDPFSGNWSLRITSWEQIQNDTKQFLERRGENQKVVRGKKKYKKIKKR